MLPTDFSPLVTKDKRTHLPSLVDFSKLLETQVQSPQAKKTPEPQAKEFLDQFNKTSADLVAKALAEEKARLHMSSGLVATPVATKKTRESCESNTSFEKTDDEVEPAAKKPRREDETKSEGEPETQEPTAQHQEVLAAEQPPNVSYVVGTHIFFLIKKLGFFIFG